MTEKYQRKAGSRMKEWGIEGDIQRKIEAAGEYPIMYRYLGTEPQSAHPFNLYGDIRSQGKALRETFEMNQESVPALARKLVDRGFSGMVAQGLGTSQFVGRTACTAFWDLAGWDARELDSLEYISYGPPIDFSRYALFSYSGSGSTIDSNRAAAQAREHGAYQVAVTNIAGSPITEVCDASIICGGGFDTGGSDTFLYTTRLAVSIWLAIEIGALSRPSERKYDDLRTRLFSTPDKIEVMFQGVNDRAELLANRYRDVRSILVVGGGANAGTAGEIALKFDEMAHIPTKEMCPGRHLHGALGLTWHDILTIIIAPLDDNNYDALCDVAQVTDMLKSPSIAFVSEEDQGVSQRVDDLFRLEERDPIIFAILAALPGQLLPYWFAVAQGDINPDCQRSDIARYARVWNWLYPKDTH